MFAVGALLLDTAPQQASQDRESIGSHRGGDFVASLCPRNRISPRRRSQAIEHTPTIVELYLVKARAQKVRPVALVVTLSLLTCSHAARGAANYKLPARPQTMRAASTCRTGTSTRSALSTSCAQTNRRKRKTACCCLRRSVRPRQLQLSLNAHSVRYRRTGGRPNHQPVRNAVHVVRARVRTEVSRLWRVL